jgi:hypothetical protein
MNKQETCHPQSSSSSSQSDNVAGQTSSGGVSSTYKTLKQGTSNLAKGLIVILMIEIISAFALTYYKGINNGLVLWLGGNAIFWTGVQFWIEYNIYLSRSNGRPGMLTSNVPQKKGE